MLERIVFAGAGSLFSASSLSYNVPIIQTGQSKAKQHFKPEWVCPLPSLSLPWATRRTSLVPALKQRIEKETTRIVVEDDGLALTLTWLPRRRKTDWIPRWWQARIRTIAESENALRAYIKPLSKIRWNEWRLEMLRNDDWSEWYPLHCSCYFTCF